MTAQPRAGFLIIGNEILSGRTAEQNLHYLAGLLAQAGVRLAEARIVRDDPAAIGEALNDLRARCDYVFTSGGIGPTHDDITTDAVAGALGLAVVVNPQARECMRRFYAPRGEELTAARLKMAQTPAGAAVLDDDARGVPGYQIGDVFVLAGVPAAFREMARRALAKIKGGAPLRARAVRAFVGESVVADALAAIQSRFDDVEIGSYPKNDGKGFYCELVFSGASESRIAAACGELIAHLRAAAIVFEEAD